MSGILAAGSQVRVGFVLGGGLIGGVPNYGYVEQIALPDMEGCLYDTGQFESIAFDYTKGGVASRDYFVISATTAQDFSQTEDFGGLVAQTMQLCAPDLYGFVSRRDPVVVDHIPASLVGMVNVQQPNAVDSGATGPAAKPPDKCQGLPFFDYVSCETGLSTTGIKTGGIAIVVGGLILIAVLLRR